MINGSSSDNSGLTSIDALYINLEEENLTQEVIQKLCEFVLSEQFGTDALRYDVMDCSDAASNVFAVIRNGKKHGKILTSFDEVCSNIFLLYYSISFESLLFRMRDL